MYPSTEDFEQIINIILRTSQAYNNEFKLLCAKDLHTFVGGYPGKNHRIPNCCSATRNLMLAGDEKTETENNGANFTIRYKLPRY